jgi:AcrR family transcriptional regulator
MAKRRYRQRKRAEQVGLTRQRIIDATRGVLLDSPFVAINLEAVARRAGVARSTIYAIFGSRLGLFEAVAADLRERGGFGAIQAAFDLPDARDILRQSLAAAVHLYRNEGRLWRALELQAVIDPDAATLTTHTNHDRIGGMRYLAELLDQQGHLRAGVSVTEVGHVLALLSDLVVYDRLSVALRLTPDQLLAQLLLLTASFLRPDEATPGA